MMIYIFTLMTQKMQSMVEIKKTPIKHYIKVKL